MVNWAGDNAIQVVLQCMLMDMGTQPVMIGKKLAQKLLLTADNLPPSSFSIVTSIGHVERATSFTWEALQLSFQIKPKDSPAPLVVRCVVMDVTHYNILVGQQAFYPLGFGSDNWTKKA